MAKIILKKDIANLGDLGDAITVRDGYARNYLIPYGFAVEASRKNVKVVEHELRKLEKEINALDLKAQSTKKSLENVTLSFTRKAGATGKLFGSVTNRDIEMALSERSILVDRKNIKPSTLKEAGAFDVSVKLFRSVKASIKVKVVAEIEKVEEEPVVEAEAAVVDTEAADVDVENVEEKSE